MGLTLPCYRLVRTRERLGLVGHSTLLQGHLRRGAITPGARLSHPVLNYHTPYWVITPGDFATLAVLDQLCRPVFVNYGREGTQEAVFGRAVLVGLRSRMDGAFRVPRETK